MNPNFMKLVKANTPEIDQRLRDGLAYHEGKKTLSYIDRLMRIHAESFPNCFKYIGIERCTPEEDYNHITRVRDNQRRYDVCKNDLRLCKLLFSYTSPNNITKVIDVKLYLPFIRRHGLFYLNDTLYGITPVVSDVVFTIKPDRIFAKLLKIKLWFERYDTAYVVDGITEYGSIFHSQIYNKKEEADGLVKVKMKHTLIHYLLAKYGLTKTMQLFGLDDFKFLTREEYLKSDFDRNEWVTIESTGQKPKRTYTSKFYEPMQTLFVVKREVFNKDVTLSQNVMCGLIHIIEHFPSLRRINPGNVDDVNTWRNTLSEVLKPSEEHIAARMEFIEKHIASLDEYIDEIVKEDLKSLNTNITNMYEMLVYIVKNFQPLTSNANKHNTGNSLYGKRLDVLSYLFSNISQQIVRTYFGLYGLKLEQERDPNRIIKEDDIMKCLKNIRPNEILRIKKDHTELMVVDDPTDLPLLKLGRIVVPQEKSDRVKTGKDTFNVNDPRNTLTVSLLECGAALDMSKGDPAGFNRINLFLKLDEHGKIVRNQKLLPIMRDFSRDLGEK